jgi:DNA-binding NarL/FixJ family response regulator
MTSVAIVEDEALYRDLLRTALTSRGFAVVGDFEDADSALEEIVRLAPDIAVLDIDLPGRMNGVQLGVALRRRCPTIGIVLLSNLASPQLLTSLPDDVAGGWSYMLKKSVSNMESLSRAIEGAAAGFMVVDPELTRNSQPRKRSPLAALTPRQLEILQLIAEGKSNAGIAAQLVITDKAVENHIGRIYTELGIPQDHATNARVLAVKAFLDNTIAATPAVSLS